MDGTDPPRRDTGRPALLPGAPCPRPPGSAPRLKSADTNETATPSDFDSDVRSLTTAPLPVLTLLYHPDLRRVGERAPLYALLSGTREELVSREHPEFHGSGVPAPLDDMHVSRTPIRLTAEADGAVRVTLPPCRMNLVHRGEVVHDACFPAEALKRGVVLEVPGYIVLLLHTEPPLSQNQPLDATGESAVTRRLAREIRNAADIDGPVLIRGETGTGPERVARAIHDAGKRRGGPFVGVSLAALSPDRAAEEIFGGRGDEPSHLRRAQGGTLFLDLVDEAPPAVQAALLRVLQTGEARRSRGGEEVDVRVVVASRLDHRHSLGAHGLSETLLYRLEGFEIWIPPLRERRDDIARLVVEFFREELERFGDAGRLDQRSPTGKGWLPAWLVAQLVELDWPGNVRQLRNVVQQIALSSRGQPRVELSRPVLQLMADMQPREGPLSHHGGERRALPTPERPWEKVVLEFARVEATEDAFGFRFGPQSYVVRGPGGRFDLARLDWNALADDLKALCRPGCPPEVTQRFGDVLQRFLSTTEWGRHEDLIVEKLEQRQQRVALTVRSAAAELYALPWELLTFRANGRPVGEIRDVLVRYEWPATSTAAPAEITQNDGSGHPRRVLVAVSARGGPVPGAEHVKAVRDAARGGAHPFDADRDVVLQASCDRLAAALDAAAAEGDPVVVLHLLCHGGLRGDTFHLVLDGGEDGDAEYVDAGRLRAILAPYASTARLVVLSACDSGNTGELGNHLGSMAQALHRAGFHSVVASRFPLSVDGSIRLATTFYTELLARRRPIEDAFQEARTALARVPGQLDWASIQLYAREADDDAQRASRVSPVPAKRQPA